MKTSQALNQAADRLAAAGIENPRREARYILAAAHGITTTALLGIDDVDDALFAPFLARRCAHEPLAYITGVKEFWGLSFKVSTATLIPRADSETLIEAAIETFADRACVKTILDIGAGTGCLLLAGLTEFPAAFGVGTDISPAAAQLANQNAQALALSHRAKFLAADWTAPINAKFELILSNPPYIPTPDLAGLMPEVQNFEPVRALDGGAEGTSAYHAIIAALRPMLPQNGAAILELGIHQAQTVSAIAQKAGFSSKIRADLAGIPRAIIIRP